MEKQVVKNLINKLNEKLEKEKCIGRNKPIVIGGIYYQVSRQKGKSIDPIIIPKEQLDKLVALSKFLRENENITQEDLDLLLKTKLFKYRFLRKLNNKIPDFLEELKTNGPQSVALYYANRIHSKKQIGVALNK